MNISAERWSRLQRELRLSDVELGWLFNVQANTIASWRRDGAMRPRGAAILVDLLERALRAGMAREPLMDVARIPHHRGHVMSRPASHRQHGDRVRAWSYIGRTAIPLSELRTQRWLPAMTPETESD